MFPLLWVHINQTEREIQMYKVYQIQMKGEKNAEKLELKRDITFYGSSKFNSENFAIYTQTATCEADTAEDVFELMNCWNDKEKVVFCEGERPYSLSVGDILEDTETGAFMMVDDYDFASIQIK